MNLHTLLGAVLTALFAPSGLARDERGGSDGPASLVLVLGAITIAGILIAAIAFFVRSNANFSVPGQP